MYSVNYDYFIGGGLSKFAPLQKLESREATYSVLIMANDDWILIIVMHVARISIECELIIFAVQKYNHLLRSMV